MSPKHPLERVWTRIVSSSRSVVVAYLIGLVLVVAMVAVLTGLSQGTFDDDKSADDRSPSATTPGTSASKTESPSPDKTTSPSVPKPKESSQSPSADKSDSNDVATGIYAICGSEYKLLDSLNVVTADGKLLGEVFLVRNPQGRKCVATLRRGETSDKVPMSAFVANEDDARDDDEGRFSSYAGPVKVDGKGKCVSYGGEIGDVGVAAPMNHCD